MFVSLEKKRKGKIIGILNKGKKNIFVDNTFSGLDIGIQDEGEDTFASGNKFNDGEPVKGEGRKWFSMNNPVVYMAVSIAVILIIAVIAYYAYGAGWPLKFSSN